MDNGADWNGDRVPPEELTRIGENADLRHVRAGALSGTVQHVTCDTLR